MCASGLRTRIRKWKKVVRRILPTGISLRPLTASHHTVTIPPALAESVQTTVYATMQPAKVPPPMSASIGVEGSSSSRGALGVMANTGSDAKRSIVVSVVSVV